MLMDRISINNSKQQTAVAAVVLSFTCGQYFRFDFGFESTWHQFSGKICALLFCTYGIILHSTGAAEWVKHFSALTLLIQSHFQLFRQINLARQHVIVNFKLLFTDFSVSILTIWMLQTQLLIQLQKFSYQNQMTISFHKLFCVIFCTMSHAC